MRERISTILYVLHRIAKIITKRSVSKRKYRWKMTTQDTSTRRRVKLYALNADRQWDDRGTGHVTSNFVDRLKGKFLFTGSFFAYRLKIL